MNRTGPTVPAPRALALLAAALLAAAAAGGCAVDEKKEIGLYRAVLDGQDPVRVEYAAGESLSLPTALLLANAHSERLAVAGEDYVQALVDKDRAASTFFPTISLVPSYSQSDASDDSGARRLFGGGAADENELRGRSSLSTGDGNFDAPVNLSFNAFRGFRDLANLRRAKSDINRFRAVLLDLQASVLLDVARAYYQVLAAEGSARVLEVSGQTQDQRVREMRTKDEVGSAQKLDVAQIEAQAASTRASLVAARNDVRNARTLLAYLTAAPVADAPLVDRLDVPAAVSPADVFLALGAADRQDLRAAQAGVESARQNVEAAFGQYYPSISLNVNYYLQRQSNPTDSEWNVLVSTNLPLFTAGRIRADHRTALSQLRQAKTQEVGVRRLIEQEVLTAYENLVASTRRLEELRIEVNAAQTALDVAEGRYRAGLGTYLERLIAQDRQLSAQLTYVNEEFSRKILYLNLLRVTGQLQRPGDPLMLGLPAAVTSPGPLAPVPTAPAVPAAPGGPTTEPAQGAPATGPATTAPATR